MIQCDASETDLGAALPPYCKPAAFSSRVVTNTEAAIKH